MTRPTPPDQQSPRRRIDLRRLPHGLGYAIAVAVTAAVLWLASLVSRGQPGPEWWSRYAAPAIYWSSPFLLAIVIVRYVLRIRRPHD